MATIERMTEPWPVEKKASSPSTFSDPRLAAGRRFSCRVRPFVVQQRATRLKAPPRPFPPRGRGGFSPAKLGSFFACNLASGKGCKGSAWRSSCRKEAKSDGSDTGMPSDDTRGGGVAPPSHVTFNYIKSQFYRVIHVDGAIGGITPRGLIHCSIYSERAAIPRVAKHPLNADGSLGDMEVIESREGVAREMEADLLLDRRAARELRDWLDRQLQRFDELQLEKGEGNE